MKRLLLSITLFSFIFTFAGSDNENSNNLCQSKKENVRLFKDLLRRRPHTNDATSPKGSLIHSPVDEEAPTATVLSTSPTSKLLPVPAPSSGDLLPVSRKATLLLSLDNSATTLDDPDKTSPAKNDADWKDSGLLEFAESQKMLHLLSINGPTKMEQFAVVSRLKAQMTALNLLRKAAQECETRITKD